MIPASVETLRRLLCKLPGVGPMSATRMVLHLIRSGAEETRQLAMGITGMAERVRLCGTCGAWTEDDPCELCTAPNRDRDLLCVVEDPAALLNLERAGAYHGLYHVLAGVISHLKGKGPEDVGVPALLERVKNGAFKEVIFALSPTVEGEATAMFIARQLESPALACTLLASGLPVGGEVEGADGATLERAMRGRRGMPRN